MFQSYINLSITKQHSIGTINTKKRILQILNSIGFTNLNQLNQETINKFIKKISHLSQDTQKKYIQTLKAFFNYCVKKHILNEKKIKELDYPKLKCKSKDTTFTDYDFSKILDYSQKEDKDFYIYLLTLYNTFSRPSEILKLKVENFDFFNRTVTIYQNKTNKYKTVYLTNEFINIISKYIDKNKISNYIFVGNNKPISFYSNKFKEIRAKQKLNSKYILYTMRHTSITNLMNKTNDVQFVAQQAGNTPNMIMKHYLNRNANHFRSLIDKFN